MDDDPRRTASIFGCLLTYEAASKRAVLVSNEETKRGWRVDEVSVYPNTGNPDSNEYIYLVRSSTDPADPS